MPVDAYHLLDNAVEARDSRFEYQIAGVSIAVYSNKSIDKLFGTAWGIFAVEQSSNAELIIRFLYDRQISYQVETVKINEDAGIVSRSDRDVLLANRAWTHCTILPLCDPVNFQVFTNQIFLTHAVQHHMIQFHASLIDDHGCGIVFLGPSGIGKTTQAERWMQYRGAPILNGDMVFVQERQESDKRYLGWGTPWHGSSSYCLNASVPVKALVVLKQAPENRLRELTGFEKVAEVSSSVFYPTWLENGMELCTDTLNHLLTDMPVYRLDNRADEEAVNLLAAEIDRIS